MSVLGAFLLARVAGAVALATTPIAVSTEVSDGSAHDITVAATASFVDKTAPPQPVAAQGDLQVARSAIGNQAFGVLALDIPGNATSASITLRTSGQPGASYGSSLVSACRVTAAWAPGTGQAMTSAPTFDCTNVAPADNAPWTFDLTPLIHAWSEGAPNLGVAIVDTVSVTPAQTTFNVIGSERVGTAFAPTAVSHPSPQPDPEPNPEPAPSPPAGSNGSGGVAEPPPLTSGGQLPVPSPAARPTPVVAPVTQAEPAALTTPTPPLPVRPEVWLLIPLSVLLLVGLVRVTSSAADGLVPAAVT